MEIAVRRMPRKQNGWTIVWLLDISKKEKDGNIEFENCFFSRRYEYGFYYNEVL